MDADGNGENTAAAARSYPNRLWDEYKLVQDKIDKIGAFQFQVKGWSVTLLGAVLYGGVVTSRIVPALFGAFLVAMIFHISEKRQRLLSKRLGRRAFAIESALRFFPPTSDARIWRRITAHVPAMRFVPGIARTIMEETPSVAENAQVQQPSRTRRGIVWLVANSNDVFYYAQYALLAVLLVFHIASSS